MEDRVAWNSCSLKGEFPYEGKQEQENIPFSSPSGSKMDHNFLLLVSLGVSCTYLLRPEPAGRCWRRCDLVIRVTIPFFTSTSTSKRSSKGAKYSTSYRKFLSSRYNLSWGPETLSLSVKFRYLKSNRSISISLHLSPNILVIWSKYKQNVLQGLRQHKIDLLSGIRSQSSVSNRHDAG